MKLIAAGELSGKLAKQIFPKMFATGEPAGRIIEREGLAQISDTGALAQIIEQVIAGNPKQVEQYKGGKTSVLNFLVGQAMKATRGQANVAAVTDLFKQKLGLPRLRVPAGPSRGRDLQIRHEQQRDRI